ncbi:cbb3-type cytochrome c oxidase subunit I [Alkalicoccus daliensis]|uniref:Cytochrome c oxidase subunit 1 n=1 Tax=Alkalicoccus daliensis TaxID=745820 RepID=A0A1H0D846_9BACI|nr:cbb3-type cytochrome c oxidase subunit I [Alkalicoccus daliensis]SDN66303.1 cytochrome c oxidase subunit 1 [Alkalicoccus daliensis]
MTQPIREATAPHPGTEVNEEAVTGIAKRDSRLSSANLYIAFIALLIGGTAGLLQGFVRSGFIELPSWISYYALLTAHGVLLVLVLSSFFSIGYLYAGTSRVLGGLTDKTLVFGWTGFGLMAAGTAIASFFILSGDANVLYTFYVPMQAHPWFYVGLAMIVVGILSNCVGMFVTYQSWRKRNPGQLTPLFAFFSNAVFVLWVFASLFIAVFVVGMVIPWAFGWVPTIDPMIGRTLFWAFGHTLVNIWMLTAISAWYVSMPKIIGGKVFSDSLARVAVVILVVANVPGGFHHQILDPGLSTELKFLHVIQTFMIIFPSLMTAFAMLATMERTGRSKGVTSLLGWWKTLPWSDARFFAIIVAMFAFIPAGLGGIINASNQVNQVVHNSMWVTGHLHLTVGTTVVLTFFGVSYWLVPYLSGRKLTRSLNKLAILQTLIWAAGMLLMSGAMHINGLLGSPRRTADTSYGGHSAAADWALYETLMAVGGMILFVGILLIMYIWIRLAFFAPKGTTEFPIGEDYREKDRSPLFMDRWSIWVALSVISIAIAYVIPLINFATGHSPGSPPFLMP